MNKTKIMKKLEELKKLANNPPEQEEEMLKLFLELVEIKHNDNSPKVYLDEIDNVLGDFNDGYDLEMIWNKRKNLRPLVDLCLNSLERF